MNRDHDLVRENIDFILSHFKRQHELFPRTIMAYPSFGQVVIDYDSDIEKSINKILNHFNRADFKDCRINSFSYNTEHTAGLEVKNRTTADFIFIDLDLSDFSNKIQLDRNLDKILRKMDTILKGAHPTVLWSGRGYHIYQPIDGMIFEKEIRFHKYLLYIDGHDLTTEFLRFAEGFFTDNRADSLNNPSIRSCLTRVPGTIHSKNGQKVAIIQKWDGNRPAIQWVTKEFELYLIQERIDKLNKRNHDIESKKRAFSNYQSSRGIKWIDNLLQVPLQDYRRYCLWRILSPYLVNVKKLSNEEASGVLIGWLEKCAQLRKLDFSPNVVIKNNLKSVKTYFPPSVKKLEKDHGALYELLKIKGTIS